MRRDQFVAGEEWAYRRERQLGAPASRVALVAMPRRKGQPKVKIRYLDGELEGMEEFVSGQHLRCPWKAWKRIERDETKEKAFLDSINHEEEIEKAVLEAAAAVLAASGEDLWVDVHRGYTRLYASDVPALERIAQRADVTDQPWMKWPAFKNRDGDLYLPNREFVQLAMTFAAAEPETVNLFLDLEEKELLREGYHFGELYPHRSVLQQRPAWALARQWGPQRRGAIICARKPNASDASSAKRSMP